MLALIRRRLYVAYPLLLAVGMVCLLLASLRLSRAAEPVSTPLNYPISLVPNQLLHSGDVATAANCTSPTVCSWLANAPAGSILLGVDPASPNPANWNGGAVKAELFLPNLYDRTVVVLKLSWPNRDGKGLHSPEQNNLAGISFDGHPVWSKYTTELGTFNDYYAAEHEPILTTLVLTESITHTLQITISAQTVWDLSQVELIAYPYPQPIQGIGYSPYRDCQGPATVLQPSTADIKEDLIRLFHTGNAIRTYAATGVNNQIPALVNEMGIPVFAGAWLDDEPSDEEEIQALIELAHTTDLEGLIVGNEYYLRHTNQVGIDYLRQRILQVRSGTSGLNLPLTTAEIDSFMFTWASGDSATITGIITGYEAVLNEVDIVMVHIYPFWSGLPIDGAAALTVNRYKAIQEFIEQQYPGQNKRVIIGETGWPSAGASRGQAVPSLENQRSYLKAFLFLAQKAGVDFLYFDAFDEQWKVEEPGGVGRAWGYSYSNRGAKYPFYGVLLPGSQLLPQSSYLPFVSQSLDNPTTFRFMESSWPTLAPAGEPITFPVYTEWLADDHFAASGFMGDVEQVSLYECDRTNPHSGLMAVRASFAPDGPEGWGGVYWQDPAENWGTLPGGHDLTGATRLTFWVRGANGGEVVEFVVGGIGDPVTPYSDTIQPGRRTGSIILSDNWQQVEIDLAGADLSRVIGGFGWVANRCYNHEPVTFYLDDIVFDFDPNPDPLPKPSLSPFYVYTDDLDNCNHFAPSGMMGDVDDISVEPGWAVNPHSGTTAFRVTYSAQASNGAGWAGLYWQEPESNWGDLPGGFDLRWANKVTFWARGEDGGERIRFFMGGIGDENSTYIDSVRPAVSTGYIILQDNWQQYTINLYGKDLLRVIGGFGWDTDRCANPGGATFYLDDITYEYDPNLLPLTPGPVFPVYTDAGAPGNHYVPSGWMGDAAIPGHVSLTECWYDNPYSGSTAIRIVYNVGPTGWAGVYWLYPSGNWGFVPGGYDLTGADRLTFWARSDTANATVHFLVGGVGYGADGTDCNNPIVPLPDSVCPKFEQIETLSLSPTWTKYTIDLSQSPPRILDKVLGSFGWVANSSVSFYLDDIIYEFDAP